MEKEASPSDSDDRVAQAIKICLGAMNGLTNREQTTIVRALAGINGQLAQYPSQIAQRAASTKFRAKSAKSSGLGKPPKGENLGNKHPGALKAKASLKENATRIKQVCRQFQIERLPEDHELIIQRSEILGALRSFRRPEELPDLADEGPENSFEDFRA
jgi:hypothetical protein